jgi:hypothetical protein
MVLVYFMVLLLSMKSGSPQCKVEGTVRDLARYTTEREFLRASAHDYW